jgi:hypothetical protein
VSTRHSGRAAAPFHRDRSQPSGDSRHFNKSTAIIDASDPKEAVLSLSKRTIEMLLDLVEIKISYMDVSDRDDARDLQVLERCRAELKAIDRGDAPVVPISEATRRPGRPRAAV